MNRSSRRALAALLLSTSVVRAAPRLSVALDYGFDPGLTSCPSEREFRESVSQQLGYDPFVPEPAHRVRAYAAATPQGIEGSVQWTDANGQPEGERRLSSTNGDCAELARGMAFAVAVQIQLFSAAESAESANSPAASGTQAMDAPSDAPRVSNPASPRWHWLGGLGPWIGLGFTPTVTFAGRVFVVVSHDLASIELGGEASLPSTWTRSDGTGFTTRLVGATCAPCVRFEPFSFCGLVKLSRISVRGLGVDEARSPSQSFAQAGARIAVTESLGPTITGAVHVDLLGALGRSTVTLNGEDAWTAARAGALLGLDVAAMFL